MHAEVSKYADWPDSRGEAAFPIWRSCGCPPGTSGKEIL